MKIIYKSSHINKKHISAACQLIIQLFGCASVTLIHAHLALFFIVIFQRRSKTQKKVIRLKSSSLPGMQSIFKRGSWFLLTEYHMPAPDVIVMVIALSSLTMWRKQYCHSPYSLLKISFCFHLFTNTELSTCNSMSVTAVLEHFLHLSSPDAARAVAARRFFFSVLYFPLSCLNRAAATLLVIIVNYNTKHRPHLLCFCAGFRMKVSGFCGAHLIWKWCVDVYSNASAQWPPLFKVADEMGCQNGGNWNQSISGALWEHYLLLSKAVWAQNPNTHTHINLLMHI